MKSSSKAGPPAARDALGGDEHHRDRGLVVGAEDRVVGVLPAVVDDDRLDRDVAVRDGVEVGAEQDARSVRVPHARQDVAGRVDLAREPRSPPAAPRPAPRPPPPGRTTDGIAQSSANSSLSRRRSASVRAARRHRDSAGSASTSAEREARTSPSGCCVLRAVQRGADEVAEQRRGPLGARLELRVELRGHEERVVGQLDHLDEPLVGRRARDRQAGGLQAPAQADRHLVAVAVALVDHGLAVDLVRGGAVVDLDRVGAQAHRAAEVGDLLLLGQEVDHRPLGLDVELGGVGARHAGDVARELADGDLHAEADAEVRDAALAGDARGADLALDAAAAEAAGDQDAVGVGEPALGGLVGLQRLGVDPVDLDLVTKAVTCACIEVCIAFTKSSTELNPACW